MENIISNYPDSQAVEDGFIVEIFKERWEELSGGRPIKATRGVFGEVSLAGLLEIWNDFVVWKLRVEPTLKEEDKMFVTKMNGKDIWVVDDDSGFTIMFPEEY